MSLITCRICGAPINKLDIRLTRCDNPDCQHRGVYSPARYCKQCGKEIPRWTHRTVYCSDECGLQNIRSVKKKSKEILKKSKEILKKSKEILKKSKKILKKSKKILKKSKEILKIWRKKQ